jgi:hypothetical protein
MLCLVLGTGPGSARDMNCQPRLACELHALLHGNVYS